jgi:hypothetical protein
MRNECSVVPDTKRSWYLTQKERADQSTGSFLYGYSTQSSQYSVFESPLR